MTTLIEKTLNFFKDITGFTAAANMGSNKDPLSVNQPQGDQEIQTRAMKEETISRGQDVGHRVEEIHNTHVSEDTKTSSSRVKTDSNVHKSSEGVRQDLRKPSLPTNTQSQIRGLANENTSLKKQLEAKQRDFAQAIQRSGELERKAQRLTGEKEDLLRGKKEAEKHIRDLQQKNQKLEEELKILKGTLHGVQEKHLHTTKLLEERTADLKGAQTFLTTVDRYGGADIMKMVEALNAEIFQGAAMISELLGDETTIREIDGPRRDAQGTKSAKDNLARCVGPELVKHLSTKSKQVQVDPLPLQLAVQAMLTCWCIFMVNSFCAGPVSDNLKRIYRRIWESEPQAVAGRWRAMTTGQAKHLESTTDKDLVIKTLSSLLCICGCPVANVNSQKTSLCLQQVVSTILDMWMQLRNAIHEGITTTEMEVFGANPNDIYEDAVMNDIYADTEDAQQPGLGKGAGRVLCTVGMGLKRSVIKRNGDGTMSVQNDITLKAKVAFPSVLFDPASS